MPAYNNYLFVIESAYNDENKYYRHVHVTVKPVYTEVNHNQDAVLTFVFQTDKDSQHWYGCHVELGRGSIQDLGEYKAQAKMLDAFLRVYTKLNLGSGELYTTFNMSPAGLIHALKVMGMQRGIYDPRTEQVERFDEVKPDTFSRWVPWQETSFHEWCMAENAEDAQRQLTKQGADSGYYADRFEAWLKAGRQVRSIRSMAPALLSESEMFRIPWVKEEEPKEEELPF